MEEALIETEHEGWKEKTVDKKSKYMYSTHNNSTILLHSNFFPIH